LLGINSEPRMARSITTRRPITTLTAMFEDLGSASFGSAPVFLGFSGTSGLISSFGCSITFGSSITLYLRI